MSMELAVIQGDVLQPGERTLEELADIANEQHGLLAAAIGQALFHAIAAGEALNAARERFSTGKDWNEWLVENFHASLGTANRYRRLATYKEYLPNKAFELQTRRGQDERVKYDPGVLPALQYIKHLPNNRKYPHKVDWEEARRLKAQGLNYAQIADLMGCSYHAVRYACDPHTRRRQGRWYAEKKKREKQAEAALKREEDMRTRAGRFKVEGGALAEVYSLIRRALQEAQVAYDQATDPQRRKAVAQTLSRLHQAEDEVSQAVKLPIHKLESV